MILSYDKDVTGHAANKDVTLRIINVADGKIRDLVQIVGGSGSDNVPNWAPDGAALCVCELPISARRRRRLDAVTRCENVVQGRNDGWVAG